MNLATNTHTHPDSPLYQQPTPCSPTPTHVPSPTATPTQKWYPSHTPTPTPTLVATPSATATPTNTPLVSEHTTGPNTTVYADAGHTQPVVSITEAPKPLILGDNVSLPNTNGFNLPFYGITFGIILIAVAFAWKARRHLKSYLEEH